jgi:hypothetical protein
MDVEPVSIEAGGIAVNPAESRSAVVGGVDQNGAKPAPAI